VGYDFSMGYHFTADVDGTINKLGGLFSGSKTVRLFRRGGPELAAATVTSNNDWSYVSITPVEILAGVEYTVAGYLDGSGGTLNTGINLPQTFGNITILGSTWASTSNDPYAIPDSSVDTSTMYGQFDIGFEAESGPANQPPSISSEVADQQSREGDGVNLQIIATDPDGDTLAYVADNLPPGLSIDNGGHIGGTVATGSAVGSPWQVTITVSDPFNQADQITFSWTVNQAISGQCVEIFTDDFETDKGWIRNQHDSDSASLGLWERANPEPTTYNGVVYQLDNTPSGSYSLVTDGRGGSGYTYDVDGGSTSITSPLISLPPGGTDYRLSFEYNFAYRSSSASNDKFSVYLERSNGDSLLFEELDDNSSSHPGNWQPLETDLSAFAGESFQIRFVADDDAASGKLVEAQVDDVSVCYVPGQSNSPPLITNPGDQVNVEGEAVNAFVVEVIDPDPGDVLTCNFSNLPSGLDETSECSVAGTISAAPGTYSVTVVANDGVENSSPVVFDWVIRPISPMSNPDTPPEPTPLSQVNMNISPASSRVGSTSGSFRVDESGNVNYRIPLVAAPGSGGLAPGLALEYNSQAGNGPVGVGWSLSGVSVIHRCAQTIEQDSLPVVSGIRLAQSDRFCLDGQRLMLIDGVYGSPGAEYRTEVESFTRVISFGSSGSGPAHFKVWRKDGTLMEFGNTEDSRIESRKPGDQSTVLLWAQNRLTDKAGNFIDFQYVERSNGPVDFFLEKVRYTGNHAVGTTPFAEFEMIYQQSENGGRADIPVSYVAGAAFQTTSLLERIDSRSKIRASDNEYTTLRSWFLAYGIDGHGRSVLDSVEECSDASRNYCFDRSRFEWLKNEFGMSTASKKAGVFPKQLRGLQAGDINGDGRPDLLLTEKARSKFSFGISFARPDGGFSRSGTKYDIPENEEGDGPVALHILDVNADGYQDVVFPRTIDDKVSWQVRLSNGGSLNEEIAVGEASELDPHLVRIMDFNGDGLSDLLASRKLADGTSDLVVLLNEYAAGQPVNLASPEPIIVDTEGIFPIQTPDGWLRDGDVSTFYFSPTGGVAEAKPFDYNGDGAVDLLIKVVRRYRTCANGQPCNPADTETYDPAGNTAGSRFVVGSNDNGASTGSPQDFEFSYARAGYYIVFVSDKNNTFNLQHVIGRAPGFDCDLAALCTQGEYADLPRMERVLLADINADGLADPVFQHGDDPGDVGDEEYDTWLYQLNTGEGLADTIQIAGIREDAGEEVRMIDLSGNGHPDLLYPNMMADSDSRWVVHINDLGKGFSAGFTTSMLVGNTSHGDSSLFADFTGDAITDHLFVDIKSDGSSVDANDTRLYRGFNLISGNENEAANLITRITDGLGNAVTVLYKPLTDSSVYSRMTDSANAAWGNGSVVYDLIAPIYVVSEATSSAPVFGNPGATSTVEYHYAGGKIQAGGRGFLGFGEVISYDQQTGIRSNTRYRQDFPFIGLPADTTVATSGSRFSIISDTSASTPPAWGGVNANNAPPSGVEGVLHSYGVNEWKILTANSGLVFPYLADSLERSYTLNGDFDRKVWVSNGVDSRSNHLASTRRTYASDDSSPNATRRVSNTYYPVDWNRWRLGDLKTTTVTHSRPGKPDITRNSGFEYDTVTGILNEETVEPGDSRFEITTSYQLDLWGNRTRTTITGVGAGTRVASAAFDDLGRFSIESRNALDQVIMKINEWDSYGNPLIIQDTNGVQTVNQADHMGRIFVSYTENGAWSKTLKYKGEGSQCPSATVFHTISTGGGMPTRHECFDGRPGRAGLGTLFFRPFQVLEFELI
jgi:hypothetical protein